MEFITQLPLSVQIILLVISHIVVFGGGYLLGVKPELEEIKKEGTD